MQESITSAECASRLGISPSYFRERLTKYPLEPIERYGNVNVYDWRAVKKWATKWGIGLLAADRKKYGNG